LKHDLASLKASLATAPAIGVKAKLTRLVPQLDLGSSPDWLFTSGRPNRYNPAGVECVYFAEAREVAQAEYDSYWSGTASVDQPVTTYYAEVALQCILDLTDVATLKALKVDANDLLKNWRRAKRKTLTQLLGQAVNETARFSAIRYPSKAAAGRGGAGANLVIFRACVRPPDSVSILGPTSLPLQKWP
jgi:RES domain-containing protein